MVCIGVWRFNNISQKISIWVTNPSALHTNIDPTLILHQIEEKTVHLWTDACKKKLHLCFTVLAAYVCVSVCVTRSISAASSHFNIQTLKEIPCTTAWNVIKHICSLQNSCAGVDKYKPRFCSAYFSHKMFSVCYLTSCLTIFTMLFLNCENRGWKTLWSNSKTRQCWNYTIMCVISMAALLFPVSKRTTSKIHTPIN